MVLSLKECRAITEMARVLYNFLPGSGSANWKGHESFLTVARRNGLEQYWQAGSKEPAIAILLEKTLENRRELFENLILDIMKTGLKYRQKNNNPITDAEVKTLNGLLIEVGFKFPFMWDEEFIKSLKTTGACRAEKIAEMHEMEKIIRENKVSYIRNKLDDIKNQFYGLRIQKDRQAAGFTFEKLLNSLFELYELNPRSPFKITGEQIDGSFELDNETYLLEAKWEAEKISEGPLLVFRGIVEGKSSITRGVFISVNGFTEQAVQAIRIGKQPNFFLMDGYDLVQIFENVASLCDLLRTKVRKLAEGEIFARYKS